MYQTTSNPDIQKLHTLLHIVEKEFDVACHSGQPIDIKPIKPLPESINQLTIAFKALEESNGHITEANALDAIYSIYYTNRGTTVRLIPAYLRALLCLVEQETDIEVIRRVGSAMRVLASLFGETLHGENRDEIAYGKPSVAIRLKNAKIYKTYMTRGMRKALKAYFVAWFDYFTANYASKLNLRRQWFHNSWL